MTDYEERCKIAEEKLKKVLHRTAWHRNYFLEVNKYDKAAICSDIIFSVDD